jgi:hypothetical protein
LDKVQTERQVLQVAEEEKAALEGVMALVLAVRMVAVAGLALTVV